MKTTQQSKVAKLMQDNPAIKPKEIAKKLGIAVQQVYVLRNAIKKKRIATVKNLQFKDKPVSNVTNTKRMPLYNENLVKENQQLAEWTMTWKQKYDKLEADYTQAKIMFLNSQAVVAYLEEKVAQLLKG